MGRSPHVLDRPVDTIEGIFDVYSRFGAYRTSLVALVDGPLEEDLLRRALNLVQERHPSLRSTIAGEPPASVFVPLPPGPAPLEVAPAGSSPAKLAEDEVHRTFRPGDPLWRCTLIPRPAPGQPHALVVGLHHSAADGLSAFRIVRDVLANCSALVRGVPPLPYLMPVAPLDELLPERLAPRAWLGHKVNGLRLRLGRDPAQYLPVARAAPAGERRTRLALETIPAEVAGPMIARCRSEGTTVNGALAAAMVQATRRVFGLEAVRISHAVNLRVGCRPVPDGDGLGCFVTRLQTLHAPPRRPTFWGEARAIAATVRRRVARGDAEVSIRATRGRLDAVASEVSRLMADPVTLGRYPGVTLSNRGRIEPGDTAPFRLVGYFPGGVGLHVAGTGLQLSCGTLDGNLMSTLVWVEPLMREADARAVAAALVEGLRRAAGERS